MAKLEVLAKRFDILDANDESCQFRINIDVLNEAFGVGRSMYARAVYPDKKGVYFTDNNPNEKLYIWMPKLYGNSSEWKNRISEDGNKIKETAEPNRHTDWTSDVDEEYINALRITFVKAGPNSPYKFAGIFANDKTDFCNHTYKRVATKIKLIGNPVTEIELLDDNRK